MIAQTVSTIIPVYERPALLRDAVESVLAQTYTAVEVIIVDDGSRDETPDVARDLQRVHPDVVRYARQANAGPGPARNAGLELARGEFIQYLDSDDLLEPRKFDRQVAALREHPDVGVCYCTTLRKDPHTGAMISWARTGERIDRLFPDFLMKRGWHTLSPLWRRSVCDRIGPWGDFRVMEDWEHDIRAGMLGVRPVHVPEPLAVVRDHAGDRASGMQSGFTPELTREFFRAHRSIRTQMREGGLTDWSYLGPFSRKMFWIARMCGERGLQREADEALIMAEEMVATRRVPREIRAFRTLTRAVGWHVAVRISEQARRFVRRSQGSEAGDPAAL